MFRQGKIWMGHRMGGYHPSTSMNPVRKTKTCSLFPNLLGATRLFSRCSKQKSWGYPDSPQMSTTKRTSDGFSQNVPSRGVNHIYNEKRMGVTSQTQRMSGATQTHKVERCLSFGLGCFPTMPFFGGISLSPQPKYH